MNFIGASLLYHASESIAFLLMVHLFHELQMWDIYLPGNPPNSDFLGLPGVDKHIKIFCRLLKRHDPDLFDHIEASGMPPELYLTEWIISFGGYMIPLEQMVSHYPKFQHQFYDGIF